MDNYIVYFLINTNNNKTYIGITNNLIRRLRQHNKELVGGAKYTTSNKGDGEWICYGIIKNLNKSRALSLERKIKILSKKMKGTPKDRRMKAINTILEDNNELFFDILN